MRTEPIWLRRNMENECVEIDNRSEAEVLDKTSETPPKSVQRNAARAAVKKVSKITRAIEALLESPQSVARRR